MKKFVIGGSVLLLVLLFIFNMLGGFNKPEIVEKESEPLVLAGKFYKGSMKNKEFGKLFDEAELFIKDNNIDATVCALYYNNPQKPEDTVRAFVGFAVKDTSFVSKDFDILKVRNRRVIEANIESHFTVAPINIYQKIAEYAEENKWKLSDSASIEFYPDNKKVVIHVPVAE